MPPLAAMRPQIEVVFGCVNVKFCGAWDEFINLRENGRNNGGGKESTNTR